MFRQNERPAGYASDRPHNPIHEQLAWRVMLDVFLDGRWRVVLESGHEGQPGVKKFCLARFLA
jgi:hypothetical protein